MDDDEKAVWEKYYKDGSDGYYYLTEDGEEHIDEVDSACMKGLMMYYYPYQMVNSDEDNEIKAGLDKMGINLDEMPEEMWAQIGEQMKPTVDGMLDSMGEDYMESTAIACTRICYDSFGYDYKAGQMSYLKWAAVKMLGMSLLMAAAAVLIAASVACGLREKVFNKVIAFSDAEINKFSTASLITRSTNDVQQIQMVTVMMLRMVLYAPILSIGGIVKVVENGAGMGWVIFIGIAAVVILMGTLMVIAMPKFKVMQTLVDRVNLVSREILTGIPVIRAFGREEREEERFDEANKDLTKNICNAYTHVHHVCHKHTYRVGGSPQDRCGCPSGRINDCIYYIYNAYHYVIPYAQHDVSHAPSCQRGSRQNTGDHRYGCDSSGCSRSKEA